MPSLNYFSKIHAWRILAFCLVAFVSTASILATVTVARAAILALPVISATKSDAIIDDGILLAEAADGKADPGETIEYTVVINNSGPDDATGLTYTDTIDPNTTLSGSASVSPVAVDDTLPVTVTGNVAINTALMATPFSVVTNDYQGQNMSPGLTISAYDALSAQGGSVSMTTSGAGIGRFTYDPPAGYEGTDTFTYTLSDNSNASSAVANRKATVTVTVSGMIWFVNNNAALACTTNGCGRLSNPYSTLAAFNAANDGTDILFSHHPAANDNIFVYESATPYAGGITLLSGQKLIGQDSTQTLAAITGLSPVTGSLLLPAMNATPAQSTTIQNAGGNGVTLNTGNTLNGFTGGNASGSAIFGSGFGTLTVADVIINSNGQALNLTNGTLSAAFPSVTSTGGTNNVALAGPLTGTLTINGGALSGATGNAFNINGGSATVSNVATIASGSSRSVNVTGLTGGTVTFSGAITDTDTGISLTTNSGATINFSGGLALSTGTNAAFTVTGGGTVNATQNNTSVVNTLTTTTGTALNVANTTIGASGLTFRSITSTGGTTPGIVLNTTGNAGVFTVTGNGGTCTSAGTCTGGSISGKTGTSETSGTPGIRLNNAANVRLNYMNISGNNHSGIYGTTVNGFQLDRSNITANGDTTTSSPDELGVDLNELTGTSIGGSNPTSITNTRIINNWEFELQVTNTSGTLTDFQMSGNTISSDGATGAHGNLVNFLALGSATMQLTNTSGSFTGAAPNTATGIQCDHSGTSGTMRCYISGSTFTNNNVATSVSQASGGNLKFIVDNNIATGNRSHGLNLFVAATGTGTVDGAFTNNIVGTNGVAGSGSSLGFGIRVQNEGVSTARTVNVLIANNTVQETSSFSLVNINQGIAAQTSSTATNVTITGNILQNSAARAIIVQQNNSTDADSAGATCVDISGNTMTNIPGNVGDLTRIRLRRLDANSGGGDQFRVRQTSAADLAAQNPNTSTVVGHISTSGTMTYSGGACTIPNTAMAPSSTVAQTQPEKVTPILAVDTTPIETFANETIPGHLQFGLGAVRGGKPLFALVQPAPALSGETVTLNIGTLPAGKSVTITFRATVDALDSGEIRTRILNQGTVSGSNFTSLTTTDPSPNADPFCTASPSIGTQTCTPVDRPNTTVVSLTRQSANPNKNASVTWQIVFAAPTNGLDINGSNFTLVSGGSVTGAAITSVTETSGPPSTTWNITATTGTGDGTLELRMVNDTGLSHDVTNQPYTEPAFGAVYTIDKTAPTVTNVTSSTANGYYSISDVISIQVVFDESVTVAGTPQLTLETGATDAVVDYDSGSANTLTFTYTVAAGENSSDLNYASINALTGTIQDAAGNSAILTLPALAAAQSLGSNKNIVIDTGAPTVTINQKSSAPAQADPTNASPINFTVVFSESVSPSFATGDVSLGAGTALGALVGTVTEIAPNDGTTYTVAVSGMTGDGTVIASILVGSVQDLAGNGNAASTSSDNTVTYDITPPPAPLVLTPANGSVINDTTPTITGTSAANVTIDVLIDGLSVGTTTSDGSGNWSFTPASALSEGPHNVKATAADSVGNISPDSNTNTFTVDTSAPTVTINQAVAQTDPTGASPINFTVIFSEAVTGFATGDVTLSASTTPGTLVGTVTGSGTTYNVAVSGMTGDGTVIAAIAAGVAGDGANTNLASTSTDNSVVYDTVVPSVTINQAVGQADPTNSGTINFTVIFSEAVTDFNDAADVSLSGTAGATTSLITGGPTTYNVAVSGMTSDGTVIADIPANAAQDAGGNANTISTSTDNTITYDATAPTVTINQAVGQADPTNVGTINFTVVFSGAVIDFDDAADVTLSGTAGATTVNITGGPVTYNVAVSGMASDGTIVASIPVGAAQDAATNGNSASTSTDNTVTYDTTAPTVTINQAIGQVDPASSSPINFTVVFSQAVTDFDDVADVTLSGTAGATVVNITGGPTTYNVAVSGMTSDGTVIATIAPNRAQDLAGNGNAASSSTDNSVIYDSQVPSVTINQAVGQADPTNSGPINFTVVFSEAVTDFDDAADVNLSGTAGATTSLITGGPATYNVAVSGMTGDGTVIVDVPAGAAIDVASNLNTPSTSSDNTVTYDATAPTVTINQSGSQADPTNVSPVNFTVIFSEAATDFDDAADITLTGTAGATTAAITGGPTTYNVAVSGMTSSGTVIATIPAGVVLDLAENTNIASTSTDNEVNYIYDVDPPVVVSSVRTDPNPTAAASVGYTVTFSEPVSGVDAADFVLNTTGTISGAAVTGVSGTGTTYTVTVSTGTGTGTLRLDIPATATIVDPGANPLSGLPYLDGEAYTVRVPDFGKTAPTDGAASQSLSPTLSWQASYGATSYEYCYSSAPGPCTQWNSVGTNTSVTLNSLANDSIYYWQVRAINMSGPTEANSGSWWSFTTAHVIPSPWTGSVSIASDQNVVAVARPHLGSEVASYIGATAGSTTQYVPMLFKGAFSGGTYNAALYIQNVSASAATLSLEFTDSSGAVVYTKADTLDPHASKGYWLPAEVGLPAGFAGGVKITSTQPILAVGRPHINGQVMTYNGMSSGATSAWLPMFFKNGFGSYNTALYVQNLTGSSANLSIEYINLDGTVACTDNDTLGANASKGYWSLQVACDTGSLPSGFVGGVKVTSTQNILAVGRVHLGTQITTYNGSAAGATSAYLPMLFRNAFAGGSYDAALYLQNVSGSSADVEIEYLDSAGAVAATQNVTLAANAISSIWLPDVVGLPDGFAGGARISSTQDIIAVGHPYLGSEITAYNGAPVGSLNAYLPMLFKNAYAAPYQSAFYIQNTSASAANVEISFYDSAGALSCIKSIDLAAGSTQSFWMPTVTCEP